MDRCRKCEICQKLVLSVYTCPRCGARYCSESCYQEHGGGCQEGFNEEQFKTILEYGKNVDEKNSRTFAKRLQKLQLEPFTDEIDISEERKLLLFEKSLGNKLCESDLNEEELNAFHRALQASAFEFVEADNWTPWWLEKSNKENGPFLIENEVTLKMKHLCCNSQRQTNLTVFQDIVEISFCYCCLMRFFRGDFVCFANESGSPPEQFHNAVWHLFLEASQVMQRKSQGLPEMSVILAIESWKQHMEHLMNNNSLFGQMSLDNVIMALMDASQIICSRNYILRMLNELNRIFKKASLNDEKQDTLRQVTVKKFLYWKSFILHHTSSFSFKGGKHIVGTISLWDSAEAIREWVQHSSTARNSIQSLS